MHTALVDLSPHRTHLFPFTLTRPIGDLRLGILTLREKWEKHLGQSIDFLTVPELEAKHPRQHSSYTLIINGILCPNPSLVTSILALSEGEMLYDGKVFLAARGSFTTIEEATHPTGKTLAFEHPYSAIHRSWDLFKHNKSELQADFELLTKGRKSEPIRDPHTITYGKENIFLEEGVAIKAAVLNAEHGPIYLAKNSAIQEGATIQGPFALGTNSRINMGTRIREGVTIGPNCKIGGEVSNSIVYGHSNKAHDGYLGNAVIGEWCNLGADTNNSNLKNNYDLVKSWDYQTRQMISTGLQFCGLFMGDHAKTGINTMLNTGTTIGVCSNVFGGDFPPTFVPSFSWGGGEPRVIYRFEKAIETARKVMARKNIDLTEADEKILKTIFDRSIQDQP